VFQQGHIDDPQRATRNAKLYVLPGFCQRNSAAAAAQSLKVQGRTIMLQNAGLVMRGHDEITVNAGSPEAVNPCNALFHALRQLGFEPQTHYCGNQITTAGIPYLLPVMRVLSSPSDSGRLLRALSDLVRQQVPLTLALTDLGSGDTALQSMQNLCESLRSGLSGYGLSAEGIGLCLHSHQMPLQAFSVIANSVLGNGPRYVFLDSLQMTRHCNPTVQAETDANWLFLWRQRKSPAAVLPAYGGMVRSACPLLSEEVAASVLPVAGVQVPASTAWLPIEIPLTNFTDSVGHMDWPRLVPALTEAVRIAEQVHDHLAWPFPRQQADAHLHRRLAFSLTGLGDLVLRRAWCPANIDSLNWLSGIVQRIRRELYAASALLTQKTGPLPAFARADPSIGLSAGPQRDVWRSRWRTAVREAAVRHRNMLVLSPYSILPAEPDCKPEFMDLLPVIRHADAWSFAAVAGFTDWSIVDYQRFHRRAWAVIQGHNARGVIAAGV
jgi:hypothetical protein